MKIKKFDRKVKVDKQIIENIKKTTKKSSTKKEKVVKKAKINFDLARGYFVNKKELNEGIIDELFDNMLEFKETYYEQYRGTKQTYDYPGEPATLCITLEGVVKLSDIESKFGKVTKEVIQAFNKNKYVREWATCIIKEHFCNELDIDCYIDECDSLDIDIKKGNLVVEIGHTLCGSVPY